MNTSGDNPYAAPQPHAIDPRAFAKDLELKRLTRIREACGIGIGIFAMFTAIVFVQFALSDGYPPSDVDWLWNVVQAAAAVACLVLAVYCILARTWTLYVAIAFSAVMLGRLVYYWSDASSRAAPLSPGTIRALDTLFSIPFMLLIAAAIASLVVERRIKQRRQELEARAAASAVRTSQAAEVLG